MSESSFLWSISRWIGSFSCCFLSGNVLLVFFLDRSRFLHVLIKVGRSLHGNDEFCSLDKFWFFISFVASSVSSRFLNIDGFGLHADILAISISNQTFCGDDTCGCGIAKSMKDQLIMLFKDFLAQIDIELLILSVWNVNLIGFNLELVTSWGLNVLALHFIFCLFILS